ncbi:MAG: hypothetical protein JXR12_05585 [Neptunomonas phycophila]|uniref:hypothetical protein n=1 Tax=Neptunomonas phycophila TaxID=1572645 RepID=UPI003B8CAE05
MKKLLIAALACISFNTLADATPICKPLNKGEHERLKEEFERYTVDVGEQIDHYIRCGSSLIIIADSGKEEYRNFLFIMNRLTQEEMAAIRSSVNAVQIEILNSSDTYVSGW